MEPVERDCEVLIVGAGYSGLAAARRLVAEGIDVLVVEARDRVGGRVFSETISPRLTIDRGGQWIGPGQNTIHSLAAEFGVKAVPTYTTGETVELSKGERRTFLGVSTAATEAVESIMNLDAASREVPLDAPWDAPDALRRDEQTLGSWLTDNVQSPVARQVFTTAAKGLFGAEPRELSLLYVQFVLHSAGGVMNTVGTADSAQERRFSGGAQQIALRMAEDLGERLILTSPVSGIDHGAESVIATVAPAPQSMRDTRAKTTRPARIRARRAIVAMPPALSARLHWSPHLPEARDHLAMRAPMGSVLKVHAIYDTPFWRDDDLNGQLVSTEGFLRLTFDDSPGDGSSGVMMGFVAGDEQRQLAGTKPGERREALLADLVRAFGPKAANPVELLEQDWAAEPFTRGGPVAFLSPGALTRFGTALREPIGSVHWAGTETALEWCGYIDGALSSGIRAAGEVLAALGR